MADPALSDPAITPGWAHIPFVKIGGLKFLDTAHVKDQLALLCFVENPRDRVAGFRILQLLPGAGPTSAQHVIDVTANQVDPIGALSEIAARPRAGQPKGPPAAKSLLERGLMRLDTRSRIARLLFTDQGLDALRVMMVDRWLANPEKFAHVRQELGLDGRAQVGKAESSPKGFVSATRPRSQSRECPGLWLASPTAD